MHAGDCRSAESGQVTSRDLWTAAHGKLPLVAYTERESVSGQRIIVSTVLIASGSTARDGFFSVYETRVFGSSYDNEVLTFSDPGDEQGGRQKAIRQHSMTVDNVTALSVR
jgi:hypothetical protein